MSRASGPAPEAGAWQFSTQTTLKRAATTELRHRNMSVRSLLIAVAAAAVFAPQIVAASPEGIAPAPGKTKDAKVSYYLADACYEGQVIHKLNDTTEGEFVRDFAMTTHGIVVTVDGRKLRGLEPSMRERVLRVLVTGWQMCQHRHVARENRADGASVAVKDGSGRVVYRGTTKPD